MTQEGEGVGTDEFLGVDVDAEQVKAEKETVGFGSSGRGGLFSGEEEVEVVGEEAAVEIVDGGAAGLLG